MADIDFSTFTNSNDVTNLASIDFQISANTLSNTNSISSVETTLVILANSQTNTNIVSNVSRIDFKVFPNTQVNTNILRSLIVSEPPIVLLTGSQVNTNVVSSIDDIIFTDVLVCATLVNSNIVSNVKIGDDKEINIGTCNNALVNIVSQCTMSLQEVSVQGVYNNRPFVNLPKLNDFNFCDISMDFIPHPLTGDIANLYDASAINQSLNNLLLMGIHENAFEDYRVGSRVRSLLFELYDNGLDIEIKQEIFATIVDREPRIYIDDIRVKGISDKHSIEISILYHIKSFNKVQQYNITLDRA